MSAITTILRKHSLNNKEGFDDGQRSKLETEKNALLSCKVLYDSMRRVFTIQHKSLLWDVAIKYTSMNGPKYTEF
jgi:hypothetical protein